ncbi:vWA domain-containing protein [Halostella litorea]|uniref:vWA domain-containing protein n=1 Tax=Halostella litorea TaxID=2528831 RepID=UPI00109320AB|nr:vWA domain-containing protein [Halostella litorea]
MRTGNDSGERAISNTVGIVLLFGMVVTGATLVFLVGGMALNGIEDQSEMRSAEMSMQEVRSDLSSLAADGEGSTELRVGEGDNVSIRTDGSMSFKIRGRTPVGATRTCTTNLTLSAFRSENDAGEHVAYQAGGVWRTSGSGSTMVSPPALSYRTEEINGTERRTFDFNIANLSGRVDAGGTTASVNQTRSMERRKQIEREMFCRDDAASNVTQVDSLTIVVRGSTYYDAWGRFLDDRMGDAGTVNVYDGNQTVIARDLPMGRTVDNRTREEPDNLLVAVNDTAGAETSHKLTFDVGDDKITGNTLEAVEIKYEEGETDLSNMVGNGKGQINPEQSKIYREDGGVVNLKSNLSSYNVDTSDGTIGFQFDDSVEIRTNDTLMLEYGSQTRNGKDGKVTNPGAPGTYNVTATLNDDSDNRRTGQLPIDDVADGLLANRTDTDEDDVPDFADQCPGTEGQGRFGCGVVSEDANALRVNSSSATLELVGTQVAEEVVVNRTAGERQPLDVMFVLDESGSMDQGYSAWQGTSDWEEVPRDEVAWANVDEGGPSWWDDTEYTVPSGKQVRAETIYGTVVANPGQEVSEDAIGDPVEIRDAEYGPVGSDPDEKRVDAAKSFIGALNNSAALNESEQDRAGAVEFNSEATLREELTHDFSDVNGSLSGNANGGTDIGAGLYGALDEFDDSPRPADAERVVVLLTDGKNDGATDQKTYDAAEDAAANNVTVYTIGLGDEADEELLQDVANTTGGQYFYVEDADDLEERFDQIAGDVTEDRFRQVQHKDVSTSVRIGGQSYPLDPASYNETVNANDSLDSGATGINDPRQNTSVAFRVDNVPVGSLVSFSAQSVDCTNGTSTGVTEDHGGETYAHTTCNGTTTRIDSTDNSSDSDHRIYTDDDDLPGPAELNTAWWQPGIKDVLDTYDEDLYTGNKFDLDESQAVVLVELDSSGGSHTNYAVFLYDADAGDRGDYEDPDDRADDTNRYVIDISPTQVEVGDEE